MRRRVCLLLLLAGVTQARANSDVPAPDGFRLDDYNAPVPDNVPGGKTVHTAELMALVRDTPGLVLVDVLPASRRPPAMQPGTPWMPEPHRDLPAAFGSPMLGAGRCRLRRRRGSSVRCNARRAGTVAGRWCFIAAPIAG